MSEGPEVVLYSESLCSTEKLVAMYKAVSHISPASDFLISNDTNFLPYLKSHVFFSASEFCFLLKFKKAIIGFSHIKVFNNELFLNKIYVDPDYQGGGYGKKLLLSSLKFVLQSNEKESFSLDVFESNKAALIWYYNIGMIPQHKTIWHKINTSPSYKEPKKSPFFLEKDKHGFVALILEGERIGSFINNKYIISNPLHISLFSSEQLKRTCLKTQQLLSERNGVSLRAIDTSHRLSISMKSALEAFS